MSSQNFDVTSLPFDVLYEVTSYLGNKSFLNFTLINKDFYENLKNLFIKRKFLIKEIPLLKYISSFPPHTASFIHKIGKDFVFKKICVILQMCNQHSINDCANVFVIKIGKNSYPLENPKKILVNKYLKKYFFKIKFPSIPLQDKSIVISATKYNFVCDGFKCFIKIKNY